MSVEQQIHQFLIDQELTLALAESCTGGQLAALFTAMPDASKYFLGSLVVYSKEMKHKILHVSNETLLENGAESRETANEMLLGVFKMTTADYGVAVTGIAGPSGGTEDKPVGTVYVALGARGKKPHVFECHFKGNRKKVIQETCKRALEELGFMMGLIPI